MQPIKQHLTYIIYSFTILILAGCGEMPFSKSTPPTAQIDESSLTRTLTDNLGVTSSQATGGAGSLLSIVGNTLSKADFSQITAAIPDSSLLMTAAPAISNLSTNGKLTDSYSYISKQFKNLGLDHSMVGNFTSIIIDYLKKTGGEKIAQLFKSSLMSTLSESAGSMMNTFSL